MTTTIIAVLCLFLGAGLGALTLAMCAAAGHSDLRQQLDAAVRNADVWAGCYRRAHAQNQALLYERERLDVLLDAERATGPCPGDGSCECPADSEIDDGEISLVHWAMAYERRRA